MRLGTGRQWVHLVPAESGQVGVERVGAELDVAVPCDRAVCGDVNLFEEGAVTPSMEDGLFGKVGQIQLTSRAVGVFEPDTVSVARFNVGWLHRFHGGRVADQAAVGGHKGRIRPARTSMREAPLEKWMRDAKIFQIFEGANQIQRMVIARNIQERFFN